LSKPFDELDRAAAKAEKSLEKRNKELTKSLRTASKAEREQKRLSKRGGIFEVKDKPLSGGGAAQDITAPEKQTFEEKILGEARKESKKEREKLFKMMKGSFIDKDNPASSIKNILNFGKNPIGFMTGVMKTLPILGGIFAAKEIAEFIVDEIIKIDKFFKVFIDEINNRVDAFRSLQLQAEIQAGLTQRIITTASGSTEPRYSYNTFEQFNTNQTELEEKFQMINNSGVE